MGDNNPVSRTGLLAALEQLAANDEGRATQQVPHSQNPPAGVEIHEQAEVQNVQADFSAEDQNHEADAQTALSLDEFCAVEHFDWNEEMNAHMESNQQSTFQSSLASNLATNYSVAVHSQSLPNEREAQSTFMTSNLQPRQMNADDDDPWADQYQYGGNDHNAVFSQSEVQSSYNRPAATRPFTHSAVYPTSMAVLPDSSTEFMRQSSNQTQNRNYSAPPLAVQNPNSYASRNFFRNALAEAKKTQFGGCILTDYLVSAIDFKSNSSKILVRHTDRHVILAEEEEFYQVIQTEAADACLAVNGYNEQTVSRINFSDEMWQRFLVNTLHSQLVQSGRRFVSDDKLAHQRQQSRIFQSFAAWNDFLQVTF
uniref:Uncharacterized protein n=1 Tax=Panagrolaimus sp. JU765 TaxID=591449 RepID=A0AC34R1H3_9BILA